MTSTGEAVIFWILGPLMVIAALGLLFARKAVHAALCVAFVMVNLDDANVLRIAPFTALGTPVQLIKAFGDTHGFEQAVHELQSALYQEVA